MFDVMRQIFLLFRSGNMGQNFPPDRRKRAGKLRQHSIALFGFTLSVVNMTKSQIF
jgi:hypothetical protein